jgi:hypothetical protein
VPCFEARELKAPAVINEAAGGADIDATFIEYADRHVGCHSHTFNVHEPPS